MTNGEAVRASEGGPIRPTAANRDSAASDDAVQVEYFPFLPQRQWHYDLEVTRSGGRTESLTAVKRIEETRTIGDKPYARFVTEVPGGALHVPDQFYRRAEAGVLAAVQGAEGKELLVLPADPRKTNSWKGEAPPAISALTGETLANQSFQHAALRYDDCVKVTLAMTVVEKSFFGGQNEVPVRLERWFAPGVGMVRELRIVSTEGKLNYLKTDCQLKELSTRK